MFNNFKEKGILGSLFPLAGNPWAVKLYRISRKFYKLGIPELPYLFQYWNAIWNGCEIHYKSKIGKKFKVSHSRGLVIGFDAELGDEVVVHSGVVIGKNGSKPGMPTIGNNVFIGSNTVIIGNIKIGNNVIIGANSFVNKDFEDNVLIGGVPARIIKKIENA